MKEIALLLLVLVVLSNAYATDKSVPLALTKAEKAEKIQYGKPCEGLSLAVRIEVKKVELGYIVYAITKLKNTSNKPTKVIQTCPQNQYLFEMTDSSGKKTPKLLLQKCLDKQDRYSAFIRMLAHPLKSGEFVEYKFNLSRRFDFSSREEYIVQCQRELYFNRKNNLIQSVYSPKITFSIK